MKFQHLVAGVTLSTLMVCSVPAVSYAQAAPSVIEAGSTGSEVVTLQNDLNALGFTVGQADGIFGPKTEAEVEAFQTKHKLTANGVVNTATWNALNKAVSALVVKPINLSKSSTAAKNLEVKHIYYNNKLITSPYGFTYNGTAYMPIWYVMSTLDKEGFTHTWSNNVWNIEVPSSTSVDYSSIKYGKGSMAIAINGTFVARVVGITHVDPASNSTTTFMPIYNVIQALDRVGIHSDWNGNTWKMTSSAQSTAPSGAAAYGNVDLRYPAPSSITADSIDAYLSKSVYDNTAGSPMTGLGASFMDAQRTYGVDANYLVAHAIEETGNGTSAIAQQKNNLFGYGAYDANAGTDAGVFPSDDYAIRFQAWEVRNNYLDPSSSNYGGSPTLTGMSVNYASDPGWASNVESLMGEISSFVNSSVKDYQTYSPSNTPPAPSSTTEPVYYLNGATGSTESNPYYNGVPYYPSVAEGQTDMFPGPLESGSFGDSVKQVQQFLKSTVDASLTVDGQYGTATETAVKRFEAAHNLPQDGNWSFSMWETYIHPDDTTSTLPANEPVKIDQIAEGMAGGYVVPWYHIENVGWVDSQYVQLTNVYRLMAAKPTSTNTNIPVYSDAAGTAKVATLHSGDFVVAASSTPGGSMYQIQFAIESSASGSNQSPGTLLTGYVPATSATFVAQQ